jgi:hypothetical protein
MVLGRRKQKTTAPPKTTGGGGDNDKAEMDKIVKEKVVSANDNTKWVKAKASLEEKGKVKKKTSLEETPRASNSKPGWNEDNRSYNSSDDDDDESRGDRSCFSSDDESMAPSICRVGTSWDDEDIQENAFFEKSVKVESHQAVVKVLEHGNTQMLILEVSTDRHSSHTHGVLFFLCASTHTCSFI